MTWRPTCSPALSALVLLVITSATSLGQSPVTISPKPWYDPNYSGTTKRIIDWGTITLGAGYEIQSVQTVLGSADVNDVFTLQGGTFSYQSPPVNYSTTITYTYGTPRPVSVPNPMIAIHSWIVSSITPPPPHPAGNRWATQTTVVYRRAQNGPNPPGPWTTITKVGYP